MSIIKELEEHGVISVEVNTVSSTCWDVYVEPGEYWDTVPGTDLAELRRRGTTTILRRDTRQEWAG
ncbi:hypothetical protein [Saccharopolyspora sp. NPDC002376]